MCARITLCCACFLFAFYKNLSGKYVHNVYSADKALVFDVVVSRCVFILINLEQFRLLRTRTRGLMFWARCCLIRRLLNMYETLRGSRATVTRSPSDLNETEMSASAPLWILNDINERKKLECKKTFYFPFAQVPISTQCCSDKLSNQSMRCFRPREIKPFHSASFYMWEPLLIFHYIRIVTVLARPFSTILEFDPPLFLIPFFLLFSCACQNLLNVIIGRVLWLVHAGVNLPRLLEGSCSFAGRQRVGASR